MTEIETSIDSEWDSFLENMDNPIEKKENNVDTVELIENYEVPKGTELYISTKTKIAYLSHPIDLFNVFWKLNVISYHIPIEGIVKKQMKFNFADEESLLEIQEKLKGINNVEEHIITKILNPEGRIKFKDIRKISIGLCNRDIVSYRSKKKSAFYNCFVIILRVYSVDKFKEIHVKVFNTGKLEIPGIRCEKILKNVLDLVVKILKPIVNISNFGYDYIKCETVLINSNFNCGFYINREKLFDILKYKYQINCVFDACSYPGIQCKYIHQDKYKISFMIFRTGSVLIVGKCSDDVLNIIYNYIKNLLIIEYPNIYVKNNENNKDTLIKKQTKKKFIIFD